MSDTKKRGRNRSYQERKEWKIVTASEETATLIFWVESYTRHGDTRY
jgi:hypothetical protein